MNKVTKSKNLWYIVLLLIVGTKIVYSQNSTAEYISQIAPPTIVKDTRVTDGNRNFFLKFPYLFVANQWSGLQILNVSDASMPKIVSTLRTKGRAQNVVAYKNYLLISDDVSGVLVIDINNINSPAIIGKIQNKSDTYWVTIKENYAVLSHGKDGFSIWDISDLQNPQMLKAVKTTNWNWSTTVQGNKLYASNNRSGLLIYDVSDMANPIKLGQFRTKNLVRYADIDGDYAFLADGPGGMEILNISNPQVPASVAKLETNGFVYKTFKTGQFVFLADEKNGLQIVNVFDINKPFIESSIKTEAGAFDVWKENIYVYLCTDKYTMIYRHNNAPLIEAVDNQIIDEQQLLKIQLKGSDPDNDPITYAAENIPEGAEFNSEAGYFSWTPSFDQAGVYNNIIFKVIEKTDTKLENKISVNFTINNVNRKPALPEIEEQIVDENSTLTYVVPEGSDPDKEDKGKLIYLAENLPEGAIFNSKTRTITWNPNFEQSGVYMVDFLIKDPGELIDRKTDKITVNHVDRFPKIDVVSHKKVNENEPLEFKISGIDPDKEDINRIEFTIENLPDGATFNETTQTFNWLPTYDQSGVYENITAKITSGPKLDSSVFSIEVIHVNRPPQFAEISSQMIDENSMLTFNVSGSDPDVEDEGKLTFNILSEPAGSTFNKQSGKFEWIPTYEQSGEYLVTFEILDPSGLKDSKQTTISVIHINRKPILDKVEPQTIAENSELTIQLIGTDPDVEDKNIITYSAKNIPTGANIDKKTGQINWTPDYDQSGIYNFNTYIEDGEYIDTQMVAITVNHVNRPPVLNTIENQVIDENKLLQFSISGSDPDVEDEGKLVYTCINVPDGANFDAETKTFSWNPTFEQSGEYSVQFSITDPSGLQNQKNILINVNHINRVPALEEIVEKTIDENMPLEIQLIGTDPDKEDVNSLVYSAAPLPTGATIEANTGLFKWTPTFEQSGEYHLTYKLSDGKLNTEKSSLIKVIHVNRKPHVSIPPVTLINENNEMSLNITVSDPDKEDNNNLTLSTTNLPDGAKFDPTSNTIKWTPTFEQSGNYSINLSLDDNAGLSDEGIIKFEVRNINRKPSITVPADKAGIENEPLTFTISSEDPDKEDIGKLKLSCLNLPDKAAFDKNSGTFTWTPSFAQAGTYNLKFKVIDAEGLFEEKTTKLTIENVNRAPKIREILSDKIKENKKWNLNLKVDEPDKEDKNKLQFEVDNLPKGCKFNKSTGEFEWTPNYEQAGQYTINAKVTDQGGLSSSVSFNLEIVNVNRKPTLSGPNTIEKLAGEKIEFNLKGKDKDKDDNLTYSAEKMPAGADLNSTSGSFVWQTNTSQLGDYTIVFKVKDSNNEEEKIKVKIKVKPILLKRPEDAQKENK